MLTTKSKKYSMSKFKTYFLKDEFNTVFGYLLKKQICNERPQTNFIEIYFRIHSEHFSIEILPKTII